MDRPLAEPRVSLSFSERQMKRSCHRRQKLAKKGAKQQGKTLCMMKVKASTCNLHDERCNLHDAICATAAAEQAIA
jgi:hypothetical protein